MKLTGLAYEVKAELCFTKAEVDLLVKHAKTHYDSACQAAGMLIGEGVRENGFIAQLRMRAPQHTHPRQPYARAVWKFRQLDTALKILEMHTGDMKCSKLFNQFWTTLKSIEDRHNKLKQEEQLKCQTDR